MKTTLTEQFPASIEVIETITNKFSPVMDEVLFFLQTTVILSATILLLTSAWI
jgi:hypothetical protein